MKLSAAVHAEAGAAAGGGAPRRAPPRARAARFRPCIDIHKGKVKQIVGSTLTDVAGGAAKESAPVTNFETARSAAEFARQYAADELLGGHVIMLGADDASIEAASGALAAYPGGLQIGGGVNVENAASYLDAGASHVIVTSYVFRDGALDRERLDGLVSAIGKDRLVLDLSCRKKDDGEYYVVTDRWQKFSDLRVNAETLERLSDSCDEFLVHAVDVEGKKLGMDGELVRRLGEWSPIPVTYAGGAGCVADLEAVAADGGGRVDVTVGSALDIFGGELPYERVVQWHNEQAA
eukprot:PRCOL_00002294-RA